MVFDVSRVLAEQIVGQFVDRRGHTVGPALDDGLTPADDALVGFHLQEAPAGRNDVGGQLRDLHAVGSRGMDRQAATKASAVCRTSAAVMPGL